MGNPSSLAWLCLLVATAACVAADANDDMMVMMTTEAPLMSSTVAPPMAKAKPEMILNEPPKLGKSQAEEKKPVMMAMKEESMPAMEGVPMKAAPVAAFITRNGQIYEVDDHNGMGLIEARQNPDTETVVCNYGSVVIYSDVPCDQMDKVKVSPVKDFIEKPQSQQMANKDDDKKDENDSSVMKDGDEEEQVPRRRQQGNRRRGPNANRRRNGQKRKRLQKVGPNRNRKGQNGMRRRRPANGPNRMRKPAAGNRRKQQGQRQRQQQRKRQQQRRRQQQKRKQQQATAKPAQGRHDLEEYERGRMNQSEA